MRNKKIILAVILCLSVLAMGGCGAAETSQKQAAEALKDSEIQRGDDELESIYLKAKDYLSQKDYGAAISELEKIPDYKDVKELLQNARYEYGISLYDKSQYAQAIEQLEQTTDYKETEKYLDKCRMELKYEKFDYDSFTTLGDDSVATMTNKEIREYMEECMNSMYSSWYQQDENNEEIIIDKYFIDGKEYGIASWGGEGNYTEFDIYYMDSTEDRIHISLAPDFAYMNVSENPTMMLSIGDMLYFNYTSSQAKEYAELNEAQQEEYESAQPAEYYLPGYAYSNSLGAYVYSVSVARLVKTVMNISFRYAVNHKFIAVNPTKGINLPKKVVKKSYHIRTIDTQKTLTSEQIMVLIEASKETPIHMQVLFNVLMGLRRSEINGLKYSDVDYVNRTLTVQRQLGKKLNGKKEDFAPKTFTKQEVGLKSESSYRTLPIPDYVFEAILEQRKWYEKCRNRRKKEFKDLDYICCSSYGRPRSKSFHWKHYKKLLSDNGLPDIRWHDLRITFCTMLLKNDFNPKAVSKLMGHAKEIITIDVYGDNQGIIADCVPEIADFMEEVMPGPETDDEFKEELLDIVIDTGEYLDEVS